MINPEEIKSIMKYFHLRNVDLADLLNVSIATAERWIASGASNTNSAGYRNLMYLYMFYHQKGEEMDKLRGEIKETLEKFGRSRGSFAMVQSIVFSIGPMLDIGLTPDLAINMVKNNLNK